MGEDRATQAEISQPLPSEAALVAEFARTIDARMVPEYDDVGDDTTKYIGLIGNSIGGSTRFEKAVLGKRKLGDLCTLTRRVPSGNGIGGWRGH